jgi:hypothetical protein
MCSAGFCGARSGKKDEIVSFTERNISCAAKPTAVEVKLFVTEYMTCGSAAW